MSISFQSRKVIICIALTVFAVIAVIFKMATFNDAAEFVKWIFGIYAVANVSESVGTSITKQTPIPTLPTT